MLYKLMTFQGEIWSQQKKQKKKEKRLFTYTFHFKPLQGELERKGKTKTPT